MYALASGAQALAAVALIGVGLLRGSDGFVLAGMYNALSCALFFMAWRASKP